MSFSSISCPSCRAVLKADATLAPDRQLRCPQCDTVFLLSSGNESQPQEPAEVLPIEPAEALKSVAPGADLFSGWNREKSTKVVEEENVWDQPYRNVVGRKPVKGEMRAVLNIIAILLVALLGGWGALVLSRDRNVNHGTGNENPLAYLHPDSSVVCKIDFGTLLSHPDLSERFDKFFRENDTLGHLAVVKRDTGLEFKELFDQVIVGVKMPSKPNPVENGEPESLTFIIQSKVPFDQAKMAENMNGSKSIRLLGKTYFETTLPAEKEFLFMPSDRLVIIVRGSRTRIEEIVASDGLASKLSPQAAKMIPLNEKTLFWVALSFEGESNQAMREGLKETLAEASVMPGTVATLGATKSLGCWGRLEGEQLLLQVDLPCANDANATLTAKELQTYWDKSFKGIAGGIQAMLVLAAMPDNLKGSAKELFASTRFENQGGSVRSTSHFSMKSVQGILDALIHEAAESRQQPRQR